MCPLLLHTLLLLDEGAGVRRRRTIPTAFCRCSDCFQCELRDMRTRTSTRRHAISEAAKYAATPRVRRVSDATIRRWFREREAELAALAVAT